jgi:hypothetical protein
VLLAREAYLERRIDALIGMALPARQEIDPRRRLAYDPGRLLVSTEQSLAAVRKSIAEIAARNDPADAASLKFLTKHQAVLEADLERQLRGSGVRTRTAGNSGRPR